MEFEDKLKICEMRLDGADIDTIAEAYGFTPQCVHKMLTKIPHDKSVKAVKPKLRKKMMLEICEDVLKGKKKQYVTNKYNLSEEDVDKVLAYICNKHVSKVKTDLYPNVTKWMLENGITIKEFAAILGVSCNTVSRVLKGKRALRPDLAKAISQYTGLSLSQITS